MKCCSIVIATLCVAFAATASAQTFCEEIGGAGTPNSVARFTGKCKVGNSNIFQTGNSVGVNTTSPQATLDVESNDVFAIMGVTSSTAPFAQGVVGQTASTSGLGVVGQATATTGTTYGVFGQTATNGTGAGVIGTASATTSNAFGVFGASAGSSGNGVFGYASSASGSTIGVSGFVESPNGTAGRFVAHAGSGLLLQGVSGSNNVTFTVDANGNGFFAGNLNVTGTVSKGGGSFKIDHPLDPANKYLSHSFVESPDMMNVYNGVVVLDARGSAWVELPEYFQALNRDYRYQLTSIGTPGPNLYIAKEVSGNRFKISGGKPKGKVSWQVTGIRQDAYANAHRIAVVEEKPTEVRGQYLHPELFNAPEHLIGAAHSQLVQGVMTGITRRTP